MGHANDPFIVTTLVVGLGALLRRTLVSEADAHGIAKVVFNLTLPALVISTFATKSIDPSLTALAAISLAYGAFMGALGSLVLFRALPRRERGLRAMLLPGFNVGLFAFPLVEAVLGPEAIKVLGMFDLGVSVTVFVGSYFIASHFAAEPAGFSPRRAVRQMLSSVPLVAYLAGVFLNLTGLRPPALVLEACGVVGRANMPLSLLVLGLYLDLGVGAGSWRRIGQVLGVRYLVGAAAGVALYLLLPFDPLVRAVVLVGMVLPPPLICVSYALQFGYDHRFVGALLNVASGVSYALLWAIFSALPRLR